jgi:hypothetical protein
MSLDLPIVAALVEWRLKMFVSENPIRLFRLIILASITVLMSSAAFGQPSRNRQKLTIRNAEREIEKLERQRLDAYLKLDRSALDRIMSDSYTSVYANGQVVTKAQELEGIKAATPDALSKMSATIDQLSVRNFGTATVLSGVLTIKGAVVWSDKEIKINAVFRYTAVYVRNPRNWQIVSSQYTQVNPADQE